MRTSFIQAVRVTLFVGAGLFFNSASAKSGGEFLVPYGVKLVLEAPQIDAKPIQISFDLKHGTFTMVASQKVKGRIKLRDFPDADNFHLVELMMPNTVDYKNFKFLVKKVKVEKIPGFSWAILFPPTSNEGLFMVEYGHDYLPAKVQVPCDQWLVI